MPRKKSLLYSATDIKIAELRQLDMDFVAISDEQTERYRKLEQRCLDQEFFSFTSDDSEYHFKFRQVSSAPYVMYGKGNFELLHKNIIAIVGPRKASPYAREVLEKLFAYLKNYDVVTISGMADGVDKMAHELSIQYQIPTIAVL